MHKRCFEKRDCIWEIGSLLENNQLFMASMAMFSNYLFVKALIRKKGLKHWPFYLKKLDER